MNGHGLIEIKVAFDLFIREIIFEQIHALQNIGLFDKARTKNSIPPRRQIQKIIKNDSCTNFIIEQGRCETRKGAPDVALRSSWYNLSTTPHPRPDTTQSSKYTLWRMYLLCAFSFTIGNGKFFDLNSNYISSTSLPLLSVGQIHGRDICVSPRSSNTIPNFLNVILRPNLPHVLNRLRMQHTVCPLDIIWGLCRLIRIYEASDSSRHITFQRSRTYELWELNGELMVPITRLHLC